jgi:alginate O-acetyltransferase complex protein AlgI
MRNFVDFSCFVSMFPHLVAGPILKFSFLAEQLERRTLTLDKFARGVAFFTLGMSKKILLANPCGKVADTVFNAGSVGAMDAWYGAGAYAFQIFLDFSAYSDMAIGLGLMLGFVFARNFDRPYRSESITEFWRRWHISLSTWLREYLYIPLGGNRKGKLRTYFNLFLTMILGGLWHGASWNYVIWGGLHGGMLAFERMRGRDSFYRFLPRFARVGLTFSIVLVSWVFFRATDLPSAVSYLKSMAGMGDAAAPSRLLEGILYQPYYLACMGAAAAAIWALPDVWEWTQKLTPPKILLCLGLFALSLAVLATQAYNPFIYFIF